MSKFALVNKIIPFSNVDGEGNRTAIFLQGCNYNCLYCHNPETINHCNNCGLCVPHCEYGALSKIEGKVIYDIEKCQNCDRCIAECKRNSSPKITPMTVADILKYLQKTRYFISGITVSGGECTLQSDFLTELFREVKKMGLTTFIDTNGSTPIYNNKELLEVMDKTMIDLKAYDSEENKMLTGLENQTVIENIKILGKLDKVYEIRTVVVPQVLDSKKTVDEGSKLLANINPNIIYKLIKYRPLGVRENLIKSSVPTQEYMEELKEIAISNGCKNVIIV
ncbi:YjjW family glycine radical enzyme activase [Clostridium sp. UBA4548]|uniref:YjjW family glycine radical enzyme activase n=1 Tax=Clostridium sp. UBA4548 TaxID=1946361 RepID=UPI0025C65182|nr:YjjW family glycine radical enzyme activase [Clostridium sp. UBA4548]